MNKFLFNTKLEIENSKKNVDVNLILFHFQDENQIHTIYSPHLDLSGYDVSLEGAKKSFKINLEEFFEFTFENNTLKQVLKDLGWIWQNDEVSEIKIKSISSILKDNEYISEIIDNYPVNTYFQNFGIPLAI